MLPKKVLLAEDDKDDQELFVAFLDERNDIELMPVAEDGSGVISFLKVAVQNEQLPDIIILDHNMPKMNGLQTLELLKDDPHLKHIPVMIYSTYADQHLTEASKRSGACLVATKPV